MRTILFLLATFTANVCVAQELTKLEEQALSYKKGENLYRFILRSQYVQDQLNVTDDQLSELASVSVDAEKARQAVPIPNPVARTDEFGRALPEETSFQNDPFMRKELSKKYQRAIARVAKDRHEALIRVFVPEQLKRLAEIRLQVFQFQGSPLDGYVATNRELDRESARQLDIALGEQRVKLREDLEKLIERHRKELLGKIENESERRKAEALVGELLPYHLVPAIVDRR